MQRKTHNCQTCAALLLELKKEEKENVIKSKDHEHKTIIQRTQSDHDRCVYDINNRSAESVSGNEII